MHIYACLCYCKHKMRGEVTMFESEGLLVRTLGYILVLGQDPRRAASHNTTTPTHSHTTCKFTALRLQVWKMTVRTISPSHVQHIQLQHSTVFSPLRAFHGFLAQPPRFRVFQLDHVIIQNEH